MFPGASEKGLRSGSTEVVMKYLLALSAVLLFAAGCATDHGEPNRATHTWNSNQGTFAFDHVSNRKVDASKAVTRSYLGETYYFESEENARRFDANPWAYLYDDNNPERSSSPGTQGVRD